MYRLMPGAGKKELEEAINNDIMINAGNPVHLIGSRFNKKVAPLDETKRDMYAAQTHLSNMVNTLIKTDQMNYEDIETLAEVSSALSKGINFLEHIEAVLEALR